MPIPKNKAKGAFFPEITLYLDFCGEFRGAIFSFENIYFSDEKKTGPLGPVFRLQEIGLGSALYNHAARGEAERREELESVLLVALQKSGHPAFSGFFKPERRLAARTAH